MHIGPLSAVGARCLIATLIIAPLVFREAARFRLPSKDQWLLMAGVIGSFTAATTLYQTAYGYTSVINSGFIVNLCCVATPILAGCCSGRAHPCLSCRRSPFPFLGIFLMGGGRLEAFNRGDVYALMAAVLYALWAVLLGAFLLHSPRPLYLMTIKLFASGVICIGLGFFIEAPDLADFSAAWSQLLFLGIFSTGIAYSLQVLAQQHVSATVAMVFVSAEAVFGALFAHFLIGESLTAMTGIGAALVTMAIFLISIDRKPRRFWWRHAKSRIRPALPVIAAEPLPRPLMPPPAMTPSQAALPVPVFLRTAVPDPPLSVSEPAGDRSSPPPLGHGL